MGYYALIIGTAILWCIGSFYSDKKIVLKISVFLAAMLLLIFSYYYLIGASYLDMFTLKRKSRTVSTIAYLYGCISGALIGVIIKTLFECIIRIFKREA